MVSVQGTLDEVTSGLLRTEAGLAPAGSLVLDLSGLVTFDEAGLALLRELVESGARIEGASRYVQLRLAPVNPGAHAPHHKPRMHSTTPTPRYRGGQGMKRIHINRRARRQLALAAVVSLFAGVPAFAQATAPTVKKPNILVIWGDDIGQYNISAINRGMMRSRSPAP